MTNDFEALALTLYRRLDKAKKRIKELSAENKALREQIAAPTFVANGEILSVEPNIYDQEERHENCTVQILRNSITGAYSFGWWPIKAEGPNDV